GYRRKWERLGKIRFATSAERMPETRPRFDARASNDLLQCCSQIRVRPAAWALCSFAVFLGDDEGRAVLGMLEGRFEDRAEQWEQGDHAMSLPRGLGLRAGHADSSAIPIHVIPRQRERFTRRAQASEPRQRYQQLPPDVRAMFDHPLCFR